MGQEVPETQEDLGRGAAQVLPDLLLHLQLLTQAEQAVLVDYF